MNRRPRARRAREVALVVALALAVLAGCRGGNGVAPPTPTATVAPTPTSTPEPTPTLEPGQRRRWGFDPFQPTGLEDPPIPFEPLPPSYRIEKLVTGLDRPTQLAAASDGRLFIAEQPGRVRVVEDGRLLDEPFVTLEVFLPDLADQVVELGLTGIALDPAFEANGYVYLYYAQPEPRETVITRARQTADRNVEVTQILSWPGEPPCCHIGDGMRFAPDGTLLVGVGDHESPVAAQNPETPPGSILRINPDGSAPNDNPFVGDDDADPHMYAYGLRNPFDIAIDPATGRIFAGENGFFGQDAVVEIEPGANYGWPGFQLRVPEDEIEQPLTFYHQFGGLAGMEFYSSDVLSELTGSLLFCRFLGGTLHQITFRPNGSVADERIRARNCTSDITTGPDGFLYYLDYVDGALYRLSVAG